MNSQIVTPKSSGLPVRVVKLGGSLLDLPDLPSRFDSYLKGLNSQGLQRIVLIVGGGQAADVVRQYNRQHHLGDHDGHWLAVRAMAFNAHCVARVLSRCQMVAVPDACHTAWQQGNVAVGEPVAWLQTMEEQGVVIPHRWSFTSDSIAAAIAVFMRAEGLTLLKSTLPKGPLSRVQAAATRLVDDDFPTASATLKHVELVNLRSGPQAFQSLPLEA